jgi:hypothetical protein
LLLLLILLLTVLSMLGLRCDAIFNICDIGRYRMNEAGVVAFSPILDFVTASTGETMTILRES